MRKYRILLVVRHPVGGIRTFFRYVYRTFPSEKYQFTLLAPDLPETRVLLEDLAELDLTYVSVVRDPNKRQFFKIATRVIREGAFDLVHSHGFTSGACSIVGALLKRTPHILTCHDVFTQEQFEGLGGLFKKFILGTILAMIDRIHCVSHDARDNLLAYLPILRPFRQKVIVIPNGIEVARFVNAAKRDFRKELGLPPDTFLIGFLGRFMSQKGFKYLIDALIEIAGMKDLPKRAVLLSFGEDGFVREERDEVKRRGLSESVYFLPFVADVASTLKGLDVVAIPSLWEACPLLPMEVMVAGVPVIGTNCVGLREVLRNTPAYVVPPKDGLALSEALILEMSNPSTATAGVFAKVAAARFIVTERAVEIEKLMLKLLQS